MTLAAAPTVGFLSARELQVLTLACDTLVPAVEQVDDPHGFWARRASDLGVPAQIAAALAEIADEDERRDVHQLLALLDHRAASLAIVGRARAFGALDPAERAEYLRRLADHPLPRFRQGFQLLKRLTLFFFYALADERGRNPSWPAIGYPGPPEPPPARVKPIRPLAIGQDTTLEADVCVVGSGAGGGVVAGVLAAAGRDVIVLEQGGYYDAADFAGREYDGFRSLYLKQGLLATRDLGVVLLAGSCLGGGTVVNWNTCFRTPPDVLAEWERAHGIPGLAGAEFQRDLDAVEQRIQVNDQQSWPNGSNAALARGCQALGYHVGVVRRNAVGCTDCGWCCFGCPRGAKQSTLVTFLQDAYEQGARLVVECRAERVLAEGGRVAGVEAWVEDRAAGRRHRLVVRAGTVVVAAGAIESPALLARSGVANPNVGRHLHLHPTIAVGGIYDEPIEVWRGVPQSIFSDQFGEPGDGHGFKLEIPSAHPGLIAASLPWWSGEEHKREMARVRHLVPIIGIVRDRAAGRVVVNRRGQSIVEYQPRGRDRDALLRAIKEAARVHLAAGAREIATLHNQPVRWTRGTEGLGEFYAGVERRGLAPNRLALFSAHQMGTCRMGSSPRTSVVNPEGESHELRGLYVADASLFPSAPGVNPMITVMALAHRVARGIAGG